MNDDSDDQQRRDELVRGLTILDEIRAGRGTAANSDLQASRLALLNGATPPAGKPHLRVIQGGKA